MGTRLKYALLLVVAAAALGALGVVVYNFAVNDWRAPADIFDLGFLKSGREPDYEKLERGAYRELEFDPAAARRITVEAGDADIVVGRGTSPKLAVEITLLGAAAQDSIYAVDIRQADSGTLAIAIKPVREIGGAGRARLTITLPESSTHHSLHLNLERGNAQIAGLLGSLHAEVSGGGLWAVGLSGELRIKTTGGNISVAHCRADGIVDAIDGSVALELDEGSFSVTATGAITATNHFGQLIARGGSGGITAQILSREPHCTLTNDAGDISLQLLPGARAALDVKAPRGQISNSLPLDTIPADAQLRADDFRRTMNGGGPPVIVRAALGSVVLEEYGGHADTLLRR